MSGTRLRNEKHSPSRIHITGGYPNLMNRARNSIWIVQPQIIDTGLQVLRPGISKGLDIAHQFADLQ